MTDQLFVSKLRSGCFDQFGSCFDIIRFFSHLSEEMSIELLTGKTLLHGHDLSDGPANPNSVHLVMTKVDEIHERPH